MKTTAPTITLTIVRHGAHWWLVGDRDAGPMGPYQTKAEAESARQGLLRAYRADPDVYGAPAVSPDLSGEPALQSVLAAPRRAGTLTTDLLVALAAAAVVWVTLVWGGM